MPNARELFSAGRLIARQKAPYFRAMLLGLAPREMPGEWPVGPGGSMVEGTMFVTARGVLGWNPEWVAKLTADNVAAVLMHEVMHLILEHGPRAMGKGWDPFLSNLSADLTINPALLDMGFTFPTSANGGAALPELFGLNRGLTREEYYAQLRQMFPPQPGACHSNKGTGLGEEGEGAGEDGEDGDGDGGGQSGAHSNKGKQPHPHCTHGQCGGGGGNKLPNEPADGDADARSQQELNRMVRQVAEEIRDQAQRARGTVPAGLARWADDLLQPPKIRWQDKLARLTRNAVAWRDGAVQHRYDAPGRRQAGIGFGPGKPVLPRMRMPVPEVDMIIDTSGSMGMQELIDAASETQGVMKAVGAPVRIAVCDAAVHGLRKVKNIQEACGLLKGGGGTDMRPAFEALMLSRPRPEVIICITDGMVGDGFPQHAPLGVKVICVLVGPYKQKPAEWCDCIEVDHDEKEK